MQLITLLVLHHIGDVWGQPSWLIKAKSKHLWSIYEHCMVWAGVVSFGLYMYGNLEPWKFFFLLIGHFVIDTFFYQVLPRLRREEKQFWYVYPDQALHYLQIFVVLFF